MNVSIYHKNSKPKLIDKSMPLYILSMLKKLSKGDKFNSKHLNYFFILT